MTPLQHFFIGWNSVIHGQGMMPAGRSDENGKYVEWNDLVKDKTPAEALHIGKAEARKYLKAING